MLELLTHNGIVQKDGGHELIGNLDRKVNMGSFHSNFLCIENKPRGIPAQFGKSGKKAKVWLGVVGVKRRQLNAMEYPRTFYLLDRAIVNPPQDKALF